MTGKKLTIQTWNIIPKIKEVDEFLAEVKPARQRIRETHPEVCFWALAGRAMKHRKKRKQGFNERKQALESLYPHTEEIVDCALKKYRRRDVAKDDILDALALAITAARGKLITIPERPEYDSRGLPMEIVHSRPVMDL
jgi:predicted RNase H-like nuclease